jgi:hypothetical protein
VADILAKKPEILHFPVESQLANGLLFQDADGSEGPEGLPAGTALKPIQLQDSVAGILQPIGNFSFLKGLVSGAEVPIQQLGYLLSGARPFDLVQRSPNVLVETTIRI